MNIKYSGEILDIYSNISHGFENDLFDVFGYDGDISIGEYVHLYLDIIQNVNYIDSKILKARFSAIGGVILLSTAEKFCELIEGLTLKEALKYCDPENGLMQMLSIPLQKMYSINFIYNAYYKAIEQASNKATNKL